MRKINLLKVVLVAFGSVFILTSCFKELDRAPKYGENAETVYSDPKNYINVLAKVYGGLSMSGNDGPSGRPDISGIDEGFSQYLRVLWNLQELPTDEAICAWGDPGIPELNSFRWNSLSPFVVAMYNRIFYQIALTNEFIRYTSDDWMNEKGFSEQDKNLIKGYQAEARFIRALSYYHALDLFGNVPFVTEEDKTGAFLPRRIERAELFSYIESELLAIESILPNRTSQDYARASSAAAQTLLAKLYLNAEIYIGQNRANDCAIFCQKVIDAGYTLEPEYKHLFMGDNDKSNEIIFPITFDGLRTRNYGGTTYLVFSSTGGSMTPASRNVSGAWWGNRATKSFYSFLEADSSLDKRYLFHLPGQTLEITNVSTFTQGIGVTKFTNARKDGGTASDPSKDFVDTDFPLFRLGDVLLMYAEATIRGGGNTAQGVNYFNQVRARAYGNNSRDVASLNLDLIFEERTKEVYWEAQRRTDLIRFNKFTDGSYVWAFKGNTPSGTGVASFYNLYPIPTDDLTANPNLSQNPGY